MQLKTLRRTALLTLSLLSACAAATFATGAGPGETPNQQAQAEAFGDYLVGRFAASQTNLHEAATKLLQAHSADPGNETLLQQAFMACLLAGRPEAVQLAAHLPENAAAQLLLADQAAQNGNWTLAESRYAALPHGGLTQLLQPLLVAWAEAGAGHTDSALSTLQPFVTGDRFRGVYAMHAGLIADLAGRAGDAAKDYHDAQVDYHGTNLRLAQILASWEARQGHPNEAAKDLEALAADSQVLGLAVPALIANDRHRQVANPAAGIAEAYLALAAALRQQQANDYSALMLQLALDLKPDFTEARMVMADILSAQKHYATALHALAPVADDDPLISLVQLRRATLEDALGNTADAVDLLDRMAKAYPKNPEPLATEGDILRSKSRFSDAAGEYARAIARIAHPVQADWPIYYDYGVALDRAHQWPQAEAALKQALALSPNQPEILNYLGYSWTEQGHNLAQARKMLDRAVQLRPNDGAIVDSLGWLLLREGDNTGAVHWLERAVELDPTDSEINGHLGDAYWAIGRKLEAKYQWRRALTLNPAPDDASRLEAKLHDATQTAQTPTTAERR